MPPFSKAGPDWKLRKSGASRLLRAENGQCNTQKHSVLHATTGALSHLRRIFDVAIENGVLHTNPALGLKRKPVRAKQLELPTRAQFAAFVTEMRAGHSRDSQNCA